MIFPLLVAFLQLFRTLIYLINFNLSAFAIVLQYVAKIDTWDICSEIVSNFQKSQALC
jgi:hypothetical protein